MGPTGNFLVNKLSLMRLKIQALFYENISCSIKMLHYLEKILWE
jgi:hypothetical protein